MSTVRSVDRDERTVAVENASYGWAYMFLSFALLVDVAYRGLVRNEAAWDLMALVVISGAVTTAYQARFQTLARHWVAKGILVACLGALVAFFVALALVLRQR